MATDIFLIILGILGTLSGLNFYRKVNKINKWPKVKAFLQSKNVKETDKAVGARRGFNYEVDIVYQYDFDDQTYTSKSYSPGTIVASKNSTQKAINKIPDDFPVFVNPIKPEESYYKNNSQFWGILAMSFGVICLSIFLIRIIA